MIFIGKGILPGCGSFKGLSGLGLWSGACYQLGLLYYRQYRPVSRKRQQRVDSVAGHHTES